MREGFCPSNWKCNLVLIQVPEFMFKKQVSATPCIFYRNSLFVQKKDKIGAFYKQGSGLTHSLVQENPEKNNSKASFSLDCAKYPPPLQSKAKPLAPLSCRFARSTGDPPGGRGGSPTPLPWLPVPPCFPWLSDPSPPPCQPLLWVDIMTKGPLRCLGRVVLDEPAGDVEQSCFSLPGSHLQSLPPGFNSTLDEVSHPPA